MEKRYQVFVSSTYKDLSKERLEVIKALLELDCIPSGMEYFPAASEDSWTYISNLIEQCDYYVVIVGGRYGSITAEGISFTQKEYQYAIEMGIPTIAFLHRSPEDLPAKHAEATLEGREKLDSFIDLLKKNLCKEWSNIHELGAVVSRSITQLIKRHPRTGWIPASMTVSKDATEEILALTKKVRELESELKKRRIEKLDTKELSDGDDIIEIEVIYPVLEKTNNWKGSDVVDQVVAKASTSWNEIFRVISPQMSPFAADASIRNKLNSMLQSKEHEVQIQLPDHRWLGDLNISTSSFETIRIQFMALELVTIGKEKTEEGTSTGIRWRLTELGQRRMLETLAILKKR